MSPFWPQLFIAWLMTAGVALAIVANDNLLSRIVRERDDGFAVQASHEGNPMRLGGIAIFAGLSLGVAVSDWNATLLPLLFLISAIPAVLAGLVEDLGYGASPRQRLGASFVSAALAAALLATWVTRADLPGLDQMMNLAPLAVILTIVVSAGFCHATNLVDGMNGLVAIFTITSSVGLAALAQEAGQPDLALLAALLAASVAGFLLFNWPQGRLFLGDAGSYGVGHVLIWIAFLIVARAPDIAVPALFLVLFWPFADASHTIYRRLKNGAPVFAPDRMHLHQKLRRCIVIIFFGGKDRRRSNPLTTLIMTPMLVLPAISGVVLADRKEAAWIAVLLFAILFSLTHMAITRLAIRRRRKFRRC